TPIMNGIYKFNSTTGGMLLHLHARYSDDGVAPPATTFPADYFSPYNSQYEVLLGNFRHWVFGQRSDACAGGITQQISSASSSCSQTTLTLTSPMPFFAPGYATQPIPFVTQLGTLIINT